jgi:hypothetical protein
VGLVAAALALVACYRDADPPAQPATPPCSPAPAPAKPLGAYDQLDRRLAPVLAGVPSLQQVADTADCPKIAAALRAFGAEHGADLDDIEKLTEQLDEAERMDFESEHEADIKRIDAMVKTVMHSCGSDHDVTQALAVAGFRRKKAGP